MRAYVEVLRVDLAVLGEIEVLLRDEHALAEEVLVDLLAVGLGDEPGAASVPADARSADARGARLPAEHNGIMRTYILADVRLATRLRRRCFVAGVGGL